jgi:hypothetical protein
VSSFNNNGQQLKTVESICFNEQEIKIRKRKYLEEAGPIKPIHMKKSLFVRFEVLTAVRMTMSFFWVVTPCRPIGLHGVKTQKNNMVKSFVEQPQSYIWA